MYFRSLCLIFCSLFVKVFHAQVAHGGVTAGPQPPAPRPRVRARRGQATDPHSIAERVSLCHGVKS